MKEKVLIVGGGGAEDALVKGYARSDYVGEVLAVPGNDMMQIGTSKPVRIFQEYKATDVIEIPNLCKRERVGLIDVRQDEAVEADIAGVLAEEGFSVVGPTREAGEIEWNKVWAREFGKRQDLPQPFFKICKSQEDGADFINSQPDQMWVIKAAGLTKGKGVYIARNRQEAKAAIQKMKKFENAGEVFLIEEFLEGEEFSSYAVSDGKNFKLIGHAQDYKRAFDNDQGENTGGMGAVSPALAVNINIEGQIYKIFDSTLKGLQVEGRPYKGILYLGGIIVNGKVYVIEFNARWGDPEAEVIVPRLKTDLFKMGSAVARGNIDSLEIKLDRNVRIAIAGASKGYPGNYEDVRGKQIFGLEETRKMRGIEVYGAGIKVEDGKDYADGGRLFYVVGEGKNVIEARERAYDAMSMTRVDGDNLHYRKDIGWRDVQRLRASA